MWIIICYPYILILIEPSYTLKFSSVKVTRRITYYLMGFVANLLATEAFGSGSMGLFQSQDIIITFSVDT